MTVELAQPRAEDQGTVGQKVQEPPGLEVAPVVLDVTDKALRKFEQAVTKLARSQNYFLDASPTSVYHTTKRLTAVLFDGEEVTVVAPKLQVRSAKTHERATVTQILARDLALEGMRLKAIRALRDQGILPYHRAIGLSGGKDPNAAIEQNQERWDQFLAGVNRMGKPKKFQRTPHRTGEPADRRSTSFPVGEMTIGGAALTAVVRQHHETRPQKILYAVTTTSTILSLLTAACAPERATAVAPTPVSPGATPRPHPENTAVPPTEAPTANPTPDIYAAFPGATPLDGAVSAWVGEDARLYNQTENRLFVWNETTAQWEVNAFTQKPADFEPVTALSGKTVDVKADKEVGVTEDILASVLFKYIKGSSQFAEFLKDPAFDQSLLEVGIKSPYEERINLVHAILNWSGGTLRIRDYTFNLNEPGTIVHRFRIVSDPSDTGVPPTPGAIVDLSLTKYIRAVIWEEAGKLVVEQLIDERYGNGGGYGFSIESSDPLVLAKTFTRFMTTGLESLAEGKFDSPLSRGDLLTETRIAWWLYWDNLPLSYDGSGRAWLRYVDAPGNGYNPMNDATPLVFDIK